MIRKDIDSYQNKTIDINELETSLPSGWSSFVTLVRTLESLTHINATDASIKDGVLYVKATSTDSVEFVIFDRVARSIMMDSARTCMICGKHGRRRKEQSGKPPLCLAHYLEYINEEENV